jgi:RNA polymerase-binding transcription factor DksA
LKFITIANEPTEINLIAQDIIVLYFSENSKQINQRIIGINPLDPDSCERIAILIRKYIIINYLNNIRQEYKYAQILKDFIHIFQNEFLQFNEESYTYQFVKSPKTLSEEDVAKSEKDVAEKLNQHPKYLNDKSRPHKEEIMKNVKKLVQAIYQNGRKLQNDYLYCLSCGKKIQSHSLKELNYLQCCDFVLDSTKFPNVIYKNTDKQFYNLRSEDWGMDSLDFNITELNIVIK